MPDSAPLSAQRVADLVMANQAIRAPYFETELEEGVQFTDVEKGLQWGADVIPALLGCFRVEHNPREDNPDRWVAFARHWRGGTIRLDLELYPGTDDPDPVLVVTAISAMEGTNTIVDEDFGEIELPEEPPTQEEWEDLDKQYHTARRKDTSDGSMAVMAFITALPGWKREVASQFDEIIETAVPEVRRAVRYHQPFYGIEDEGWFASFGAFSKHVKLTFVCGSELDPQPPSGTGPSRQALDVTESEELDEKQVASWIRQAAADPGMNW